MPTSKNNLKGIEMSDIMPASERLTIWPPPGVIVHVVGDEDATGSFPVGSKCFVDPLNLDGYAFEGLHILEHRDTGKRLAKHIQVQYDGVVRAFSNDKGDVCKEFFIDIAVPRPEWLSIGRVNWMFAEFN
jgi:hypothetical protein